MFTQRSRCIACSCWGHIRQVPTIVKELGRPWPQSTIPSSDLCKVFLKYILAGAHRKHDVLTSTLPRELWVQRCVGPEAEECCGLRGAGAGASSNFVSSWFSKASSDRIHFVSTCIAPNVHIGRRAALSLVVAQSGVPGLKAPDIRTIAFWMLQLSASQDLKQAIGSIPALCFFFYNLTALTGSTLHMFSLEEWFSAQIAARAVYLNERVWLHSEVFVFVYIASFSKRSLRGVQICRCKWNCFCLCPME